LKGCFGIFTATFSRAWELSYLSLCFGLAISMFAVAQRFHG
jgi:hypothetical protein